VSVSSVSTTDNQSSDSHFGICSILLKGIVIKAQTFFLDDSYRTIRTTKKLLQPGNDRCLEHSPIILFTNFLCYKNSTKTKAGL